MGLRISAAHFPVTSFPVSDLFEPRGELATPFVPQGVPLDRSRAWSIR